MHILHVLEGSIVLPFGRLRSVNALERRESSLRAPLLRVHYVAAAVALGLSAFWGLDAARRGDEYLFEVHSPRVAQVLSRASPVRSRACGRYRARRARFRDSMVARGSATARCKKARADGFGR